MNKATLTVEGLGSIDINDMDSYEVAESFMRYLHNRMMRAESTKKMVPLQTVDEYRDSPQGKKDTVKLHSLNKNGTIDRTVWSQEEKDFLIENHKMLTAHTIGVRLGRTTNSVKSYGYKMGLKFKNKRRKGVKRGSYHKIPEKDVVGETTPPKSSPDEYKSLGIRIRECKPKLVIDVFLKENPDVKRETLTSVLSRMIAKRQATQISPNVVQVHDTKSTSIGYGLS